jgi:hypothetical protein
MNRPANTLLALAFWAALTPMVLSQDRTPQPCPDVTPGTLGCQLVAWSQLQEPVPLPESETKPATPPDQQPGQTPDFQSRGQASRRTITGIIVRQGDHFVLKAIDNTMYRLDDQGRARRYQDIQVRVVGRLIAASNTFDIESIELAS